MKKLIPIMIGLLLSIGQLRAQTTLSTGDIIFTGFNVTGTASIAPDTISFVLLANISSTTVIYFTDRGYTGSGWNFASASEGTIAWTSGTALPIGTEITIAGLGSNAATVSSTGLANGTVTSILGNNVVTGLNLGNAGDQVIAFQGGSGDPTNGGANRIAGIHFNNCSGSSDATWDIASCTGASTFSTMPPGLTGGTNAFWAGATSSQGRYICTGTPYSSVATLRASIMNKSNWIFATGPASQINVPSACTYYSTCTAPSISVQPANRTACISGSTTMFVTASGTGLSYRWQQNFGAGYTNLSNDASHSNVTSNTLTITPSSAGMSGYMYRCVVTGTCGTATSTGATLTVSTQGLWLGTSSTAWSNTANWSCGTLPTASTHVTINSGAPNMPVIDIPNAVCNNLTIGGSASLTFNGTTNGIDIKGAITNSGIFTTSSGKVSFSGNAQFIPAGTYRELAMAASGNKTLNGNVNISNALTLTTGHISLGGFDLNMGSTASITGGDASSFVIIDGAGKLRQANIGAAGRTGSINFPVGINASSFTPIGINNAGAADEFAVSVVANVHDSYSAGDAPTGNAITSMVVNRTWTVTEAIAGGSNVTLNFQWNADNETTGFIRSWCHGSHYKNGIWNKGANGSASGSDPYSISMTGITSFSPFAVGTPGSTLPLNLLSFQASVKSNAVDLNWSTSNEVNTAGFDIERSPDGANFTRIGNVAAKDNSASTNLYRFTDNQVATGSHKYRLKMIDKDGKHTYSNTISVRIESIAGGYELFPNPVTGSSVYVRSLSYQADAVIVKVADITGKIWYSENVPAAKINSGQHAVSVRQLPAGSYLLIIAGSKDGKQQTLQFTK